MAADKEIEHAMGLRFARYWVEYAERYGVGKESYKQYDRLEAEWANLNEAANWLWEMALVKTTAEKQDAMQMMVDLARSLSSFLFASGRWDERVTLATYGYEAARTMKDAHKAGWRAYDRAWIHLQRGHTDEAVLWMHRCEEAWAPGGSKAEQANITRLHGLIAREYKDYNHAEQCFEECLSILRDLNHDEGVAATLNDLGNLARNRKKYDAAERYYLGAWELVQKIDDKAAQATYSANLGLTMLVREQWSEARKWFEQQLPLAREIGRIDLIASGKLGLARVWEEEGRADLALPLAEEALAIRERLQHKDLPETRGLVKRLKTKA